MSDKKQLVIPPGASPLPAAPRSNVPTLPMLPSGNSAWITEHGRYEPNALTIGASTKVIDAKTAQFAAFTRMVREKEELLVALASYDDVDLRIAHKRELGRISRTAELRREELQSQIAEINLKIEVAAANMRLAAMLPIPEAPAAPTPQPVPAPTGLTPADIKQAAQRLPEMHPETIDTLCMILSGFLAEKNR